MDQRARREPLLQRGRVPFEPGDDVARIEVAAGFERAGQQAHAGGDGVEVVVGGVTHEERPRRASRRRVGLRALPPGEARVREARRGASPLAAFEPVRGDDLGVLARLLEPTGRQAVTELAILVGQRGVDRATQGARAGTRILGRPPTYAARKGDDPFFHERGEDCVEPVASMPTRARTPSNANHPLQKMLAAWSTRRMVGSRRSRRAWAMAMIVSGTLPESGAGCPLGSLGAAEAARISSSR